MRTPIVPDSFRLLPQFGPSFLRNRAELKIQLDGRFAAEWRTPRRWALDRPSPFEFTRVLDPAPNQGDLNFARQELVRAFPAFASMQVNGSWGGMIDVSAGRRAGDRRHRRPCRVSTSPAGSPATASVSGRAPGA